MLRMLTDVHVHNRKPALREKEVCQIPDPISFCTFHYTRISLNEFQTLAKYKRGPRAVSLILRAPVFLTCRPARTRVKSSA